MSLFLCRYSANFNNKLSPPTFLLGPYDMEIPEAVKAAALRDYTVDGIHTKAYLLVAAWVNSANVNTQDDLGNTLLRL